MIKLCLAGGPMRNTPFGNAHNKKPYDGRPFNHQQAMNNQYIPKEDDFATYPQPLIGKIRLNCDLQGCKKLGCCDIEKISNIDIEKKIPVISIFSIFFCREIIRT